MISRLSGELLEKQAPTVLIDISGIGYEVLLPMTSIYALPEIGEKVILHTHFIVREDSQQLFGFIEKADRRLFQELIKINGIGPKVALAILSGMDGASLISCIEHNDSSQLTLIPGIGKKTAERLIIDMKDKIDKLLSELNALSVSKLDLLGSSGRDVSASKTLTGGEHINEAISALEALGYKYKDAKKKIMSINTGVNSTEELIRLALKSVVKS
jgi:holliday junction DNA helicase RuvA